ncbi:cytochrome d ubiquinol oxidase subunit II [Thiococcus pfennigii]|uniref:cytochrome d ubiquinol oxidase subunit II n=1 Tax=Thiococcus pfennigii TaxID=1057 RepID=UPI001907A73E|nr:cytochrome d ubiquinol oxidase subunit II [Thiococcus pfennigii]MBK1702271.1 cytochrome d ubiquinol oxidase subunit II [Thiococcus pfennigii]MBK1733398.1 cytochrome d ubiquinol oxidase subunit II [Thiococcus pfennigii]
MEIYLLLKVTWWILLGVLLMGLAIMVGMDMGVGTVLRWVGRTDSERRVALNIIGPHWDGNQVWFILGGGAIFAAWPIVYATAFSGLYVVMLLLLWSMIVRPLGFEYRSKLKGPRWRNAWDWSLFVSGFVPMLVFGAAIGNALQGFPFHFEWHLASFYTGSFLALFNPFAILCGLLSVALSVYMGCAMLMIRGEGELYARARGFLDRSALAALALFTLGGIWVVFLDGYQLVQGPAPGVAQTPLQQEVVRASGAWLDNFLAMPLLWLVPGLAYLGLAAGRWGALNDRPQLAWWLGALAWIGVIGTVGAAMFPFMMPSSAEPSHSLTVWNASSSEYTLMWMLGFTVVFMPLILWYTSWAFWVMRGKVSAKHVEADDHAY